MDNLTERAERASQGAIHPHQYDGYIPDPHWKIASAIREISSIVARLSQIKPEIDMMIDELNAISCSLLEIQ